MEKISSILRRSFSRGKYKSISIFTVPWEEIAGESIAKNCTPKSFHNGILIVSTSNSSWANEMGFLSGDLKKMINEYFKKDIIREIRFIGVGFRKNKR